MPRVLSYTPSWLSRPWPGFDVFAANTTQPQINGSSRVASSTPNGPSKTIALRGTEIFVAVGNEIRWSDLAWLKEIQEEDVPRDQYGGQAYRVLKASIHGDIRQLLISPLQDYLAIVTQHTVHVMRLPDSSLLSADDTTPLKPKIFQIGPTAHVVEEAPVVSVLWHPLGELGRCLVTVTRDAILRLWEINQDNKLSFGEASLSVDLKKLANAASANDDLRASRFGSGKTYTPDLAFLEPAAVCFGANTPATQNPWALMTLWVATVDGDVYALCPLLPKKWQPFDGMMESLFLYAAASDDQESGDLAKWFSDLHDQDPLIIQSRFDTFTIYNRPRRPGPVPRMQGPFLLDPVPKHDFDLTDIFVTESAITDAEELDYDEDEDDIDPEELSSSLIFLLTANGNVHVCLDTEGVEAQWLPSSSNTSTSSPVPVMPDHETHSLLTLETVELYPGGKYSSNTVPSFTPDIISSHSVFITHGTGVSYLSLTRWSERLQQELEQSAEEGSALRYTILLSSPKPLLEHLIQFPDTTLHQPRPLIAAAAVLQDSDVGYLLLTTASHQPFAATLDLAQRAPSAGPTIKPDPDATPPPLPPLSAPELSLSAPRDPYQPAAIFFDAALPRSLTSLLERTPAHERPLHAARLRLSEASLALLVGAHRAAAAASGAVADAASDLFRRADAATRELRLQVRLVDAAAAKVDALAGDYDGEGEGVPGARRVAERLRRARERQGAVAGRVRRLAGGRSVGGRVVGEKEAAFGEEVRRVAERVGEGLERGEEGEEKAALVQRLDQVKRLRDELVRQVELVGKGGARETDERTVKVGSEFRRAKEKQVMDLLEREEALLEAVTDRVNRLSMQ